MAEIPQTIKAVDEFFLDEEATQQLISVLNTAGLLGPMAKIGVLKPHKQALVSRVAVEFKLGHKRVRELQEKLGKLGWVFLSQRQTLTIFSTNSSS